MYPALAGAAATWLMDRFALRAARGMPEHEMPQSDDGDPATVELVEKVLDQPLEPPEKELARPLVHYAFGAALGLLVRRRRSLRFMGGVPFGAGLWLATTMTTLPALKVLQPPTRFPARAHALGLAAHVVFGGALVALLSIAERARSGPRRPNR